VTTKPGIVAAHKLAYLGYRFTVVGEIIKARYEGPGEPDPHIVRPLFKTVKAHRDEVLFFLKSCCPRCGGVAFCTDLEGKSRCLACDWTEMTKMYPGLAETKH
jgi:ribosomal protein S27AE